MGGHCSPVQTSRLSSPAIPFCTSSWCRPPPHPPPLFCFSPTVSRRALLMATSSTDPSLEAARQRVDVDYDQHYHTSRLRQHLFYMSEASVTAAARLHALAEQHRQELQRRAQESGGAAAAPPPLPSPPLANFLVVSVPSSRDHAPVAYLNGTRLAKPLPSVSELFGRARLFEVRARVWRAGVVLVRCL